MRFYLSGAIDHDKKHKVWKQEIINKLQHKHTFLDPFDFVAPELLETNGDEELYKDVIRNLVIESNLSNINRADAILVYVKRGVRLWGTIAEVFYAKYIKKKPVYMITELSSEELNLWEIALVDKIFYSIDAFVKYMETENAN